MDVSADVDDGLILKLDVNQKAIFSVNQKMDQLAGGKTDSVHGLVRFNFHLMKPHSQFPELLPLHTKFQSANFIAE